MPLPWLEEKEINFPPVEMALDEPNGLLAAGGQLSPEWLLCAYRQGIFPWFDDIEGTRRKLTPQEIDQKIDDLKPHIGTAITGHRIHELELISFHKRGFGINIILTDDEGNHI